MQIHDLNTKTLTDPAYVAFDDGTDTYKADFKAEIDNAAASAVADADLTDNTVAFTSGDAESPTEWTEVDVLTSGLPIKTLFNRISTMIKNVRWLYSKLGTTDISSIGGGTVTGAISSLNSKIYTKDYSFSASYAAGTVGTRGAQVYVEADTNVDIIGISILYIASSTEYYPVVFYFDGKIYCNLYRASTRAIGEANHVTARVTYRRRS